MCLEKFGEWHKSPINAFLHLVALVVLIYGLWMHDWTWIIIAIVIAIVGHLIQAMTRKKPATVGKVKIKRGR